MQPVRLPVRTALGSDNPAPDSPGRRVAARCLRQVCARIRARCNRSTRYRWPFSDQQIVSLLFSYDGVGVGSVEKCELDFDCAVKEVFRNSAPGWADAVELFTQERDALVEFREIMQARSEERRVGKRCT